MQNVLRLLNVRKSIHVIGMLVHVPNNVLLLCLTLRVPSLLVELPMHIRASVSFLLLSSCSSAKYRFSVQIFCR